MAGDRPLRRLLVATALIATLGSAGCRADAALSDPISPAMPAAIPAAVRATVEALNAGAGGTPSDQRQRLLELVDPDRRERAIQCPAATTTVRFEPVYAGLRAVADGSAATYVLPTLIRVYDGGRLVGTDVAALQLVVNSAAGDGAAEAYLTPFCVN